MAAVPHPRLEAPAQLRDREIGQRFFVDRHQVRRRRPVGNHPEFCKVLGHDELLLSGFALDRQGRLLLLRD